MLQKKPDDMQKSFLGCIPNSLVKTISYKRPFKVSMKKAKLAEPD